MWKKRGQIKPSRTTVWLQNMSEPSRARRHEEKGGELDHSASCTPAPSAPSFQRCSSSNHRRYSSNGVLK